MTQNKDFNKKNKSFNKTNKNIYYNQIKVLYRKVDKLLDLEQQLIGWTTVILTLIVCLLLIKYLLPVIIK